MQQDTFRVKSKVGQLNKFDEKLLQYEFLHYTSNTFEKEIL